MHAIANVYPKDPPRDSLFGLLGRHWDEWKTPNRFRIDLAGILCPRALYRRAEGQGVTGWSRHQPHVVQQAIDQALEHRDVLLGEPVYLQRNDLHLHGLPDLVVMGKDGPRRVVRLHALEDEDWRRLENREA